MGQTVSAVRNGNPRAQWRAQIPTERHGCRQKTERTERVALMFLFEIRELGLAAIFDFGLACAGSGLDLFDAPKALKVHECNREPHTFGSRTARIPKTEFLQRRGPELRAVQTSSQLAEDTHFPCGGPL